LQRNICSGWTIFAVADRDKDALDQDVVKSAMDRVSVQDVPHWSLPPVVLSGVAARAATPVVLDRAHDFCDSGHLRRCTVCGGAVVLADALLFVAGQQFCLIK